MPADLNAGKLNDPDFAKDNDVDLSELGAVYLEIDPYFETDEAYDAYFKDMNWANPSEEMKARQAEEDETVLAVPHDAGGDEEEAEGEEGADEKEQEQEQGKGKGKARAKEAVAGPSGMGRKSRPAAPGAPARPVAPRGGLEFGALSFHST